MSSRDDLSKSSDYKDLLSVFNAFRVRYLVVGGYAVMQYTEPRYTKDLDVWIDRSPPNARRVYRALASFGAPLKEITENDFSDRYSIVQIGMAPVRIDIIMNLPGVRFSTAWSRRKRVVVRGLSVNFISRADLIKSKKAAGRRSDLIDLDSLMGKT